MAGKLVELDQTRRLKQAEDDRNMWLFIERMPPGFKDVHCAKAREMLGWTVEALAFRSGVSTKTIRELELGTRTLRRVTLQALPFALEAEGLIFFPGHKPMKGGDCIGATTDPRGRRGWELLAILQRLTTGLAAHPIAQILRHLWPGKNPHEKG